MDAASVLKLSTTEEAEERRSVARFSRPKKNVVRRDAIWAVISYALAIVMPNTTDSKKAAAPRGPGLLSLLKPYGGLISALVALTILANSLNLLVPRLISSAIDSYVRQQFVLAAVTREFFLVALGIFILTYLQSVVQTYASERVARDLRTRLIGRISRQDHAYIQRLTPATLLTN